jgi:hypothetical protein
MGTTRTIRRGGTWVAACVAAIGLCWGICGQARARPVAGTTRTSVNRGANVNRRAKVNRSANVNQKVNFHRDIDVDVDRGHYHPVAATAAVVGATAVTAAAVGSVVNTLPPSCTMAPVNNVTYQNCGGTYYQPRYSGTQVSYVVVNPP